MRKKVLAVVLTLALAFVMSVPASVSAASKIEWTPPTEPIAVDTNIVKVGAHAAAKTFVSMLGGNLVADRESDYGDASTVNQKTLLGAFGSDYNQNPDPYIWNWWYNTTEAGQANPSEDALYMITARQYASPMAADLSEIEPYGVSYTILRTPDILANTGYDAQIAKYNSDVKDPDDPDYDPIQFQYKCSSLPDFCESMYALAGAMEVVYAATGKTGRYDSADRSYTPMTIAKQYEAFMKGIQLYVTKKINDGTVPKRDVAIIYPIGIDTDADGIADLYRCYDSATASGTAASCRGAEYVENTVNNIIDVCGLENQTIDGTEGYYATPDQILQMDAVVTGVQASGTGSDKEVPLTTEEAFKRQIQKATGCRASAVPGIMLKDPADIFGIRMNSAENVLGVPLYQGFVYPEVINPIYGAMYIYENFWHMKNEGTAIATLAETNFADASLPDEIDLSAAGYSSKAVQNMIDEGINYYWNHQKTFAESKLELTDNFSATDMSKATVTIAATKATYTGKVIKPAVKSVKFNGKTLKAGTDYTVAYKNNKKVGTATVTVSGKGDYYGAASKTFKIVPKKAVIKATAGKKKITVKVTNTTGATKYNVAYRLSTKSKWTTKTTTKKTYVIKSLKSGKKYKVKVRGVNGAWSAVKTVKVK